jgi:hypothetical protein
MFSKAFLLLTAAAAASPAQKFDLVCVGSTQVTSLQDKHEEPFNTTYRVDLDAKKWCSGGCGAIHDIYSVQPAVLQLEAPVRTDTVTEYKIDESFISRETGQLQAFYSVGRGANIMMWNTKAMCQKQPFSGFPAIETKF